MNILHGRELADRIRNMFEEPGPVRCAVAFWGPELARLAKSAGAEVILDVSMGGTSRNALREFGVDENTAPGDKHPNPVRVMERLHAKIYLSPNTAIVGSANASRNALGQRNSDPALFEVGVLIDRIQDPEGYEGVEKAYNICRSSSHDAGPADFARAVAVSTWPPARDQAPSDATPSGSLLDELLAAPMRFSNTAFVFADQKSTEEENREAEDAYKSEMDEPSRRSGRTMICILEDDQGSLDSALRKVSFVVMYWLGSGAGIHAYHDIVRVEHEDDRVSYFGRRNLSSVVRLLDVPRMQPAASLWRADLNRARRLSETNGEAEGERFVLLDHGALAERLERNT